MVGYKKLMEFWVIVEEKGFQVVLGPGYYVNKSSLKKWIVLKMER